MSFISYAQNYEDVMLWRALKHINNGFYIDVGAAWPEEDSVTKAFYDRGWQGINIEPNPLHYASLVSCRPNDNNLKLAIGAQLGHMTMNFVGSTGLSTLDASIANQHKQFGWEIEQQLVDVEPLWRVCQAHVPTGQEIHFLKIDVEGYEELALKSNDWDRFRPWIVLVEATLPMTQTESFEEWEPILLTAAYRFVYADGLNRFYVANEHYELLAAFKYPPNIFDGFLSIAKQRLEDKAQQALAEAQRARDQVQHLQQLLEQQAEQARDLHDRNETRLHHILSQLQQTQTLVSSHLQTSEAKDAELTALREELYNSHLTNHNHWQLAEQRQQQIDALYRSSSWHITAPLRWSMHQWRLLLQHGPKSRAKALAKKMLRKLLPAVVARPRLFSWAKRLSNALGLTDRLKPFVKSVFQTPYSPIVAPGLYKEVFREEFNFPVNVYAQLTPRARQIYADLKAAIEWREKGNI